MYKKVLIKIIFVIMIITLFIYAKNTFSLATDKILVSNYMVSLASYEYTFTGKKIEPKVIVKSRGSTISKEYYKVTYSYNLNAGTAEVKVVFSSPYEGVITKNFKIKKVKIKNCKFNYLKTQEYTGKNIKVDPRVYNPYGGKRLKKGRDFEIEYKNNINTGTAKMIITGKGKNYTGSVTKTFEITKVSLPKNYSPAYTTPVSGDFNYRCTGKPIKPKYRVTLRFGGEYRKLKLNKDFTVKYYNNIKPGKAKVVIKGKGNYKGTITIKNAFTIHNSKYPF